MTPERSLREAAVTGSASKEVTNTKQEGTKEEKAKGKAHLHRFPFDLEQLVVEMLDSSLVLTLSTLRDVQSSVHRSRVGAASHDPFKTKRTTENEDQLDSRDLRSLRG